MRKCLDEARQHSRAGDYAKALEQFDYFFDHALDEDDGALYGVRLSFCLAYWAELAETYPPAKQRLLERKADSIDGFLNSEDAELFHDFAAICKYLEEPDTPLDKFDELLRNDKPKADIVVQYIWDDLINAGRWNACKPYLADPEAHYRRALAQVDNMAELYRTRPEDLGPHFERSIRRTCVEQFGNLLKALANIDRRDESKALLSQLKQDLEERELDGVLNAVRERAAI